jgi:predicted CXXCH cytochrome family protein
MAQEAAEKEAVQKPLDEQSCLVCHTQYLLAGTEGNHLPVELWVDFDQFTMSVHGDLYCVECHTDFAEEGHCRANHVAGNLARKSQYASAALEACADCHEEQQELYRDSIHGIDVLAEGEPAAAYCTDCHGYHYILPSGDPRALSHPDNIPGMCLACHAETRLRERFGLTKYVDETYMDSFHRRRKDMGADEVPVCSTCHGNHALYPSEDPRSMVHPLNIASTCQPCHEGAEPRFGESFTHTRVAASEMFGLYLVKQIHKWIIVVVIDVLSALVLLNMLRTKHLRNSENHV